MTPEFELIERFFTRPAKRAVLGVGDDCALVHVPEGETLAVTTDLLIEGRHFLAGADPRALGHKVLAVNLSDLAAMGAAPHWFTLALALPAIDEGWLQAFSAGLFALADDAGVELIGGDTTAGALSISITAMGTVPLSEALRRDGARAGDDVWLSGSTGDAALALAHLQGLARLETRAAAYCLQRLHAPQPRIELGLALRGIARSAADVSDGLLADLGHILERSNLGAEVWADMLPRSAALTGVDPALALNCLVAGGDDYELVFTARAEHRRAVMQAGDAAGVPVTRIGRILEGGPRPVLLDESRKPIAVARLGFDHFAGG